MGTLGTLWPRIVSALLGVWLMAAPAVLGYGNPAQTNDRIVGPLAGAFAYIALFEVTRGLRWLDLPLGLWLIVAPFLLGYRPGGAELYNSLAVGALLVVLTPFGGRIGARFGGGWSSLLPGRETS